MGNGILNVSAQDKASGKSNQITITNEKGRLSQADIDRMVSEAEKYKSEDDVQKLKIKDKFEDGDKEKIEAVVKESLEWLDRNQMAEKEEFEAKQKEVEAVANPIMMKVYQGAGGDGGMPDMSGMGGAGAPDMGGMGGPSVEEVD